MSRAWMPFYIGDYLRDTLHLSTEEHGAYLLLIFAAWDRGNRLPEADLAAITRAPAKRWAAMRDRLAALFTVEDGIWMHRRVQRELGAAERRSGKARESANAKWEQMRKRCLEDANASPEHMPAGCYSQSQSQVTPSGMAQAPPNSHATTAVKTPEGELYARGKQVLGRSSGGQIKKLLAANGGNVALARAVIERASASGDAGAYVAKAIGREAGGAWDGSFN